MTQTTKETADQDIVERLRNDDVVWGVRPSLAFEAADEIERLRKDYALAWENHLLHEQLFVLTEAKIERLREDLDLTQKISRIEIDAKIRYAWALRQIEELKPDAEFGAVPIETAQRIASEALKWKE